MCFANKKWQPMISGFLVRALCMWENSLEFLIKTFGLGQGGKKSWLFIALMDPEFLWIIHTRIIKVLAMEAPVCFIVIILLACVLLQTRRKNQTKEGKARSSSLWCRRARKRPSREPPQLLGGKSILSLSARQPMHQPEFVLTGGF